MTYETLVSRFFEERVKQTFKTKPELIPFFLKHERRNLAERNFKQQIFLAELRFGRKMDLSTFQQVIHLATDTFCKLAVNQKEQSIMSDAKKQQLMAEANREKDAQEWYEDQKKEALDTAITSYPTVTTDGHDAPSKKIT